MIKNIIALSVASTDSLLTVIHKMDETAHRLLIVLNNGRYGGLVSIGDIQRAIINGVALDSPIEPILRLNATVASVHDDMEAVKEIMRDHLRRSDIVTRVGPTSYAMLLPTVNYSTGTMVMERIERVFYDEFPNRSVVLHSRIAPLGGRIDEA